MTIMLLILPGKGMQYMDEYVFVCEDSIEGILNGVYEAYIFKKENKIESHDSLHLAVRLPDTCRLFTEYVTLETNYENAAKVINTIRKRLGEETYYRLCLAGASCFEEKADAVYHAIALGLRTNDRNVLDRLGEDCVQKAFKCARASANELNHTIEFMRFLELEGGILYAKINAKHKILPFVMPHFSDRLPMENFVIYDENADIYGLHPSFKAWYLAQGVEFDSGMVKTTAAEEEYQELFKRFCKTIAIESRENKKLQRNLLPFRFRPNMTEFMK